MKRWIAAAAAVLACTAGVAGAAGVTSAGPARAATALTWKRVYQSAGDGIFVSMAAVSVRNVWAVGAMLPGGTSAPKLLIRHFDGSSWKPLTIPGATMSASRVQATSASNVWVFGATKISKFVSRAGAYRWDGKHWHKIPLPANLDLTSSVVLGPSNVWVCGIDAPNGDVFHWNGHTWKPYDLNFFVQSMSASSGSNVWLTGVSWGGNPAAKAKTFRWNGSRWLAVPAAPRPVVTDLGVLALSPSNVWLGWAANGFTDKAAHWNGRTWTTITTPGSIGANAEEMVPDGRGGYWFGPMVDWTGKTWLSGIGFSPDGSGSGFGAPVRIPGTTTALLPAGFSTSISSLGHPAVYRLTLG